jgi:hypothetical protein
MIVDLKEKGIPAFEEKNNHLGGVWYEAETP